MPVDLLRRDLHRRFLGLMSEETRVDPAKIGWPDEQLASGSIWTGNNHYRDMRGATWHFARRVTCVESAIIERFEHAAIKDKAGGLRAEGQRRIFALPGLDLGTAALVVSLSAAGGVPIASCNAGAFGGSHSEPFPVVSFYWPREKWALLRGAARAAHVKTWLHDRGEVVVGAKYIRSFLLLARELQRRHGEASPERSGKRQRSVP